MLSLSKEMPDVFLLRVDRGRNTAVAPASLEIQADAHTRWAYFCFHSHMAGNRKSQAGVLKADPMHGSSWAAAAKGT